MAVVFDSDWESEAPTTSFSSHHEKPEKDGHHVVHHFHYPANILAMATRLKNKEQHLPSKAVSWTPSSDIRETKAAYHIEMELPGVADKNDIMIQWMSPRTVMIEGKATRPDLNRGHEGDGDAEWEGDLATNGGENGHRRENGERKGRHDQDGGALFKCADTAEERTTRIILGERNIGSWRRSFTLPIDVDMKSLKAKLEFGLLHISVFKREISASGEPVMKIEIE